MKKNKILIHPVPPDLIRKLKDENLYLRGEIREEKYKLTKTIGTLNKELEEVKEDNRKLINEIEHYEQLKEKMYYTI